MKPEIIPAILSQTKEDFDQKFRSISECTRKIHIDVADGTFVNNKTIDGVAEVSNIEFNGFWDVHLMVSNPIERAKKWLAIADVSTILVHISAISPKDFVNLVGEGRLLGVDVGIVADLEDNIDNLASYIYDTDIVQCMTVKPGFYGSEFDQRGVELAKKVRSIFPNKKIYIDGGINLNTIEQVANIGVDKICVGSYIMNSDNPCQSLNNLRDKLS